MIFNMGGGGVSFNFKFVGGTAQPENPSENTIWVNTENKITNWYFSIDNPLTVGEIVEDADAALGSYTMMGLDGTLNYSLTKASSGRAAAMQGCVPFVLGTTTYYSLYLVLLSSDKSACDILSTCTSNGVNNVTTVEAENTFVYDGTTYYYSYVDLNRSLETADSYYASIEEIAAALLPMYNSEGSIWVKTGDESDIAFNALKKNLIQIKPLSASQCISGLWVEKEAQIYQGGEWKDWVDWSKWIVKDGVYKTEMVAVGKKWDSSFSNVTSFTVAQGTGSVTFKHGAYCGIVYWGLVDLTDASTLTIEGEFNMSSDYPNYYALSVWSAIGTYVTTNRVANAKLSSTGATLDVSSLTGQYYVGFTVRNSGSEKVTNLWIE